MRDEGHRFIFFLLFRHAQDSLEPGAGSLERVLGSLRQAQDSY